MAIATQRPVKPRPVPRCTFTGHSRHRWVFKKSHRVSDDNGEGGTWFEYFNVYRCGCGEEQYRKVHPFERLDCKG